jgi:hypothetical protein
MLNLSALKRQKTYRHRVYYTLNTIYMVYAVWTVYDVRGNPHHEHWNNWPVDWFIPVEIGNSMHLVSTWQQGSIIRFSRICELIYIFAAKVRIVPTIQRVAVMQIDVRNLFSNMWAHSERGCPPLLNHTIKREIYSIWGNGGPFSDKPQSLLIVANNRPVALNRPPSLEICYFPGLV